jgi:hypothetical protein
MDQTLGYARVSTADQNPDLHVDELTAAGCHRIFVEHATGARAEDRNWPRPSTTRSGDILGVWRLDRLARSLRDLIEVVTDLEQRGVGFRSLHERVRSDPRAGVVRTPVASPRSEIQGCRRAGNCDGSAHSDAAPNATLALGVARQVPCTRTVTPRCVAFRGCPERSPRPPADSPAGFSRDRGAWDERRSQAHPF